MNTIVTKKLEIIRKFNKKMKNEFLKVLVLINGVALYDIHAESHRDLEAKFIDNPFVKDGDYIKATFSPKEGHRLDELDEYELKFEQMYIPDWFTYKEREKTERYIKTEIISPMIITGEKTLVLGQGAILAENAAVNTIKHSTILAMYDNAKIDFVDDNTEIMTMCDAAYINETRDHTIIHEMFGYAKIKCMRHYSKINLIYGQAKVGEMYDYAGIKTLKGDAKIIEMHEKAEAKSLRHMSKVTAMHGNSYVDEMWDWTKVEKMFDNATIGYMDDDAVVGKMYGESVIEYMAGNATVEKLYQNSLVKKLVDKAKILEQEINDKNNKV